MTRWRGILGWTVTFVLTTASGVLAAETTGLHVTPPDRGRGGGISPEAGLPARPPDRGIYEPQPVLPPAFVPALTKQTRRGRFGAAGWLVPDGPATSRGAGDPDAAGWLGFGLAGEWRRPASPPRN